MTKEELFNQNIKLAYYFANRYRVNYPHEMEDIKQVALLGLWKAANKYNGKTKFATFACAVMSNTVNYYLRHVKKHSNQSHLEDEIGDKITLADVIASDNSEIDAIETKFEFEMKKSYMGAEISKLSARNQEVIKRLLRGETQCEIAKKMSLSQPQVSKIRQRIINDTKKALEGIST